MIIIKTFSLNTWRILTISNISNFGVSFHGFTDLRTGRSSPCITRELPEAIPNSRHSKWPHFKSLEASRWRGHFGGTRDRFGGGEEEEEETKDLT